MMTFPHLSAQQVADAWGADPAATQWLQGAQSRLAALDAIPLRGLYAAAGRTARGLAVPGLDFPDSQHWSAVDWVRSWVTLRGLELTQPERQIAALQVLFEGGEMAEQESLLRTLCALPDAGRFVDVAVSACRTNATSVFEAIACENPYPARYFPALNFNQMVMKAVFMKVALVRVVGLGERVDDELRRMAGDFASERRAAGRPVPEDLALIVPGVST